MIGGVRGCKFRAPTAAPRDILPEEREHFEEIRQNITELLGLEFKAPESHLILIDTIGSPIELPASLSEYDRCVYDSVCSLSTCNRYITPGMVYNAMTGGKGTGDYGEKQLDAVRNSLEKLSSIRISIDCNAQYQSYGVTCHDSKQWTFISKLLHTRAVRVCNGGNVYGAYELLEEPVLLAYARPLGQVLSVPEKLLDIREVTADNVISEKRVMNTERRIALRGYLLRRIEEMRGVNAMANRCISFASYEKDGRHHKGLYEIWGLSDTPNAEETFKVWKYARTVLKYWTALGYISGFEFKTNGGGSIEIALSPGRGRKCMTD